jgi:hypothetical protein
MAVKLHTVFVPICGFYYLCLYLFVVLLYNSLNSSDCMD